MVKINCNISEEANNLIKVYQAKNGIGKDEAVNALILKSKAGVRK